MAFKQQKCHWNLHITNSSGSGDIKNDFKKSDLKVSTKKG